SYVGYGISSGYSQDHRVPSKGQTNPVFLRNFGGICGESHKDLYEEPSAAGVWSNRKAFRERAPSGVRSLRSGEAANAVSFVGSGKRPLPGILADQARNRTNRQVPELERNRSRRDPWRSLTIPKNLCSC